MLDSDPPPPAWVYKRNGRLVPFEADKISRALFAATDRLHKPNAFLARELTDGVLHFLALETGSQPPTTTHIADLVVKVVRELGHPELSQAFVEAQSSEADAVSSSSVPAKTAQLSVPIPPDASPLKVMRDLARAYSLQMVYAKDIVAAYREGLIDLAGLESPLDLSGVALEQSQPGKTLAEAFFDSRNQIASCLVIDGPEYLIAEYLRSIRREQNELANAIVKRWWLRELTASLPVTGLTALVNLNTLTPPPWAEDLASGPLFEGYGGAFELRRAGSLSHALLLDLLQESAGAAADRVRVDWHLSQRDFTEDNRERLLDVARLALLHERITFVFDQPRQMLSLGEGLDRRHPAVLATIGLNLVQLAEQPGVAHDPGRFIEKLGSLARLALTAATQKREFLRRVGQERPALVRGFLLGKARLLAAPVGLDAVVERLTGEGLTRNRGLEMGLRIVERLKKVMDQEGHFHRLEVCLDSPIDGRLTLTDSPATAGVEGSAGVGLTTWRPEASWTDQLRATGALQVVGGPATAALFPPPGSLFTAEQLAEVLRHTYAEGQIGRIRLMRPSARQENIRWQADSAARIP